MCLAGHLHEESILHSSFHSNKFVHANLDDWGKFIGFKWPNIFVAEMQCCICIIIKMSLTSLDVDGYRSLSYCPFMTHYIPYANLRFQTILIGPKNIHSFWKFSRSMLNFILKMGEAKKGISTIFYGRQSPILMMHQADLLLKVVKWLLLKEAVKVFRFNPVLQQQQLARQV